MMEMVFAHVVEPFLNGSDFPCRHPFHGDVDHVIDEHTEDEQRIAERDDRTMIRPIPFDGETGQRKSEKGCPTVSKKNHGRLAPTKIVWKKSDPGPNDGDGEP